MKTVDVSNLKAQLSARIQLVKDGEEVLVCDRNKPIARIVPCRLTDHSEQEQRLVARGVLRLPLKKRPASVLWPVPPGNVSDELMEQARQEEREGRVMRIPTFWDTSALVPLCVRQGIRRGLLPYISSAFFTRRLLLPVLPDSA
jgi:antitoxin (DNA-binding transcriptional repressor) of toxin-antitoxin stability system